MRSKKSFNAPLMYPKFSGVPSTMPSHQRTSSTVASNARFDAHFDVVDVVARRTRDDRVGERLGAARPRVGDDEEMTRIRHYGRRCSWNAARSKARCSRTSPTWSTTMWRTREVPTPTAACELVAVATGHDGLQRQRRRLLEHDE